MIQTLMARKPKPTQTYPRITIGVPALQKQLLLIDKIAAKADDLEFQSLSELATFLADLFSRLQRQKTVTLYRVGRTR